LIELGGVVGTLVSVFFLIGIATINFVVLVGVYRLFQRARRGKTYTEEELNVFLSSRGLFGRLLRGLFRLISRSWHMYPLGFLFGLGFDTATEIGVLGISAAEASKGLSVWSILVFPALFTAGMSLVDSSDGVLMVGAYGWAFMNPVRKLYYNLAITGFSVVVAVLVGAIEALGLVGDKFGLEGGLWLMARYHRRSFRGAWVPRGRHIRSDLARRFCDLPGDGSLQNPHSRPFIVNFSDIDCNLGARVALSRSIVSFLCIRRCSLPRHRNQLTREEPRSSRPGFRFSAGRIRPWLAIRRHSRPLSRSCHATSAGTPIVRSRARFRRERASAVSGVRPKLAPSRM
jgi:HoxN/HupN/NixA family high-affinity nickel-transporter